MSMVNMIEWCAQFRARWGFSIIILILELCRAHTHAHIVQSLDLLGYNFVSLRKTVEIFGRLV